MAPTGHSPASPTRLRALERPPDERKAETTGKKEGGGWFGDYRGGTGKVRHANDIEKRLLGERIKID